MYGLIVPPGTPPDVAEALEGTHGNPAIDEMQSRMALADMRESPDMDYPELLPARRPLPYAKNATRKTNWFKLGDKHGRQ